MYPQSKENEIKRWIINLYSVLICVLYPSESEWYIVWCSTPALAAGARAGRASFGGAVMPRDDRGLVAGAKAVMLREKIDE